MTNGTSAVRPESTRRAMPPVTVISHRHTAVGHSRSGASHARQTSQAMAKAPRNGQAVCQTPVTVMDSVWELRPERAKRTTRTTSATTV